MNLEVLAWAQTRQAYMAAMTTAIVPSTGKPFATLARTNEGTLITPRVVLPHPGLNLDEIGQIVATPAVFDPNNPMGPPLVPAVMIGGHHVNMRFHEPLSEELVEGLPQTDAEGNLLSLWQRTHFLQWFPDAVWHEDTANDGVPGGYIGTKNLKLFDPAVVKNRSRLWA